MGAMPLKLCTPPAATLPASSGSAPQDHPGASPAGAKDAKSDDANGTRKAAAGSKPLAVFDITIGMTDREVARVLQRKGLRQSDFGVSYQDSAMNKLADAHHQKFVAKVNAFRHDKFPMKGTRVEVGFKEDLPDRPGIGVCTSVSYRRDLDPGHNFAPLKQQVIDDLISRYGQPNEKTHNWVAFGDPEGSCLSVNPLFRDRFVIALRDRALEKRLANAEEKIREQINAIDTRPVPTNVGRLDY